MLLSLTTLTTFIYNCLQLYNLQLFTSYNFYNLQLSNFDNVFTTFMYNSTNPTIREKSCKTSSVTEKENNKSKKQKNKNKNKLKTWALLSTQ